MSSGRVPALPHWRAHVSRGTANAKASVRRGSSIHCSGRHQESGRSVPTRSEPHRSRASRAPTLARSGRLRAAAFDFLPNASDTVGTYCTFCEENEPVPAICMQKFCAFPRSWVIMRLSARATLPLAYGLFRRRCVVRCHPCVRGVCCQPLARSHRHRLAMRRRRGWGCAACHTRRWRG